MRFKQWFLQNEYGGAATTGMHGGITEIPGAGINNRNFPAASKWDCKDGSDKRLPDQFDDPYKKKPKDIFGFKRKDVLDAARKRGENDIDITKRGYRMTTVPPDTVY